MSLPTTLYLKNFQDLFAQSDFVTAIFHSVVLTLVSEVLIVFIVPMAAYAMERRRTRTTIFIYTYFLAGMMIPFHLYMFPLFKEMKMFGLFGNCLLYTSMRSHPGRAVREMCVCFMGTLSDCHTGARLGRSKSSLAGISGQGQGGSSGAGTLVSGSVVPLSSTSQSSTVQDVYKRQAIYMSLYFFGSKLWL